MNLKNLRRARPDESEFLSNLALRSKGYWGYSESFLDACREELTYSPSYIVAHSVFVLEVDRQVIGFYALGKVENGEVELEALFLEPSAIGGGLGGALMDHATERALELGARTMLIHGDPHATKFYVAKGAEQIGTTASGSIPGREIPLFRIQLRQGTQP